MLARLKSLTSTPERSNKVIFAVGMAALVALMGLNSIRLFAGQNAGYGYGYYGYDGSYGYGDGRYATPPVLGDYGNGTLIKVAGDAKTYVIEAGEKYWIPSMAVFNHYGFDKANIKVVSAQIFAGYPTAAASYFYRPGTFAKVAGDAKIYAIDKVNGAFVKRHVANSATFLGFGFTWADVMTRSGADAASLNSMSEGTAIASAAVLPNGTLVKVAGNAKVYLIENGQKRWIPTMAVFNGNKFSQAAIRTIGVSALAGYTNGDNVFFRPGTIVKVVGDPKVYFIDYLDGIYQKHHFSDGATFLSLGYKWAEIQTLTGTDATTLAGLPTGTVLGE